jgi:hypothetical protein
VSFDRNRDLLPRTRDYTRFASRGGWPVNQGIPIASVERSMGRSVPRLRVTDLSGPGRGHGVLVGRDAVGFFRPNLRSGSPRVAPREDARMTVRGGGARDAAFGRGFESRGQRMGDGGSFDRQPANDNRDRGGVVREQGPVDRGAPREWGGGQARQVDRGAPREWGGGQARQVDRGAPREWGGGQAQPDRTQDGNRNVRRIELPRGPDQRQQPARGNGGGGRDRKNKDHGNRGGDNGGEDQDHRGHGKG